MKTVSKMKVSMEKRSQFLCYSGVYISTGGSVGGDCIAWVMTARSKEEINNKYPHMVVLEANEVLEEKLNLPHPPGDVQEIYKKRLGQVHKDNRVDVDDIPRNALALAYVQGKKMRSFLFQYKTRAGVVQFIRIYAQDLNEIRSEFPSLEIVELPTGRLDARDPILTAPVYCIDHVSAISEELNR